MRRREVLINRIIGRDTTPTRGHSDPSCELQTTTCEPRGTGLLRVRSSRLAAQRQGIDPLTKRVQRSVHVGASSKLFYSNSSETRILGRGLASRFYLRLCLPGEWHFARLRWLARSPFPANRPMARRGCAHGYAVGAGRNPGKSP